MAAPRRKEPGFTHTAAPRRKELRYTHTAALPAAPGSAWQLRGSTHTCNPPSLAYKLGSFVLGLQQWFTLLLIRITRGAFETISIPHHSVPSQVTQECLQDPEAPLFLKLRGLTATVPSALQIRTSVGVTWKSCPSAGPDLSTHSWRRPEILPH